MSVAVDLDPAAERIDLLTFAVECRHCGAAVRPEGMSRSDGVTAWLAVQCVAKGCRKHFAIKVEMLAVPK